MRITGAVIVCICCVFLGVLLCREEKGRIKTLDEILFVMRHIRDEIWTRRTPTEVIFASVCSPRLSQLGFYEILKKEKDLYTAAHICGIKGEELAFIKEFSEKIGKTDAENQKGEFDYIISKTEEYVNNLRRELPKKQKLNVTLPVFFGVLFVIIFL